MRDYVNVHVYHYMRVNGEQKQSLGVSCYAIASNPLVRESVSASRDASICYKMPKRNHPYVVK
jgi:hypothetical protein